ncbi:MAG: OstA-like protein [Rikenellaceae bacterium]
MRRALLILLAASIFIVSLANGEGASEPQTQLIDVKADLVFPHKINDTLSVLCFVGRFAAQHNGAVITADSAVRFENERLECFGNVLINKNTTYAYADEAIYDGYTNIASLISPLVKVIDEDVTMYSHNFNFNTLTNIGEYWDGGITIKVGEDDEGNPTESVMESRRGFYFSNTKRVVGVEQVELASDVYLLSGDSVVYDMNRERAYFFENTNIWSNEQDYIYGDNGVYDRNRELCVVNRNSYMLTSEQEAWCDTMIYYTSKEEAVMYGNIQIDDTTNKSMVFAHFAHYWGADERVVLTRNPALFNYDSQTEVVDTLFLRGDTILVNSRFVKYEPKESEEEESDDEELDELDDIYNMMNMVAMSTSTEGIDSLFMMMDHAMDGMLRDSMYVDSMYVDTLMVDSLALDSIAKLPPVKSKSELKREERTARWEQKRHEKRVKEHERLIERRDALRERIEDRMERGKSIYSDSMVLLRVSDMLHTDSIEWGFAVEDLLDSVDSLSLDSLNIDSLATVVSDSLAVVVPQDSVYRTAIAFGNVKIYRSDLQVVCDSLVAQSIDSTMHLHKSPLLWNGINQIEAKTMIFYTKGGALDYADFFGNPIMSSELVDGSEFYYNQITGKIMTVYFENNQVVQNDVDGNVRTIYYMQDELTGDVTTITKIESGDASFYIENQELTGLTYRSSPTYIIAPLDKMPVDVDKELEDFKWHSDRRPTRESVFDYTIRPSQREHVGQIERPSFPIRRQIEEERERFVRLNKWEDRSDGVSPEATEWMIKLGFTPGEPRPDDMTL